MLDTTPFSHSRKVIQEANRGVNLRILRQATFFSSVTQQLMTTREREDSGTHDFIRKPYDTT